MTKPMIKLVNAETGEEIEREMNAKEFAQYQEDIKQSQEEKATEENRIATRDAVLAKLGLSAEEAAALLS